MKQFAIFVVLVVACIAGLGFYRGWFHVASETDTDKRSVTFTADPAQIKQDEKQVVDKVQDMGHRVKEKGAALADKSKDKTPEPAQPSPSQN